MYLCGALTFVTKDGDTGISAGTVAFITDLEMRSKKTRRDQVIKEEVYVSYLNLIFFFFFLNLILTKTVLQYIGFFRSYWAEYFFLHLLNFSMKTTD